MDKKHKEKNNILFVPNLVLFRFYAMSVTKIIISLNIDVYNV